MSRTASSAASRFSLQWARVDDGRVIAPTKTEPYASIVVECDALPQKATGFITHRIDFLHLWRAFNERGVRDDEEVIVVWTKDQEIPQELRPAHVKVHAEAGGHDLSAAGVRAEDGYRLQARVDWLSWMGGPASARRMETRRRVDPIGAPDRTLGR